MIAIVPLRPFGPPRLAVPRSRLETCRATVTAGIPPTRPAHNTSQKTGCCCSPARLSAGVERIPPLFALRAAPSLFRLRRHPCLLASPLRPSPSCLATQPLFRLLLFRVASSLVPYAPFRSPGAGLRHRSGALLRNMPSAAELLFFKKEYGICLGT